MGASASTQLPPFETVEAALTAGKTQDEIDAWHASQEGGELTMTTSQNGHDEFPNHFSNSESLLQRIREEQPKEEEEDDGETSSSLSLALATTHQDKTATLQTLVAFTCPPIMSEAAGAVKTKTSKGTKQPLVRVDDDLDVDSLLAEFTNLKFTIQKGTATETNIGRLRETIDNELTDVVPDWDTLPTCSGVVFIAHMPTTKTELRTKCQPFESSTVQIKIAPHPFARGGVRAAYRALVLHKRVWKEYILKMFLAPKNRTSEQYLDQLESNNVAKCLAKIFMTKTSVGKRAAKIGQHISFLESRAVRVTKEDGQIVWYNMEKVIDGTFDKWTDNIGYCNPRPENRTLLEFAKWTYEWTDGFMMATDLQGGKSARKGWVLTDPAMLCQDLSRFGPTNFHEAQLQMCYEGAQHALENGSSLEDCLLGSSYAPGFSRHDDGSRFGAARGRADARARLRREKERKKREKKKKKKKPAGDLRFRLSCANCGAKYYYTCSQFYLQNEHQHVYYMNAHTCRECEYRVPFKITLA